MTEFLSRRERREAERSGTLPTSAVPQEEIKEISSESVEVPMAIELQASVSENTSSEPVFLSRRERRLAEGSSSSSSVRETESEPTAAIIEPEIEVPAVLAVPPVADLIAAAIVEQEQEALPTPNVVVEPADFTGSTMLAEPTTQSIVLEVAPEAIALPLDTGEIVTTGSISILADVSTDTMTSGLDGLAIDEADRVDAVTGVLSIVEPVSALDVINDRVHVGVVPDKVLNRGWWQPWAFGALGLVLAISTIVATIAILNAIGE